MGDRVLVVIHSEKEHRLSPVIYGHWSGGSVGEHLVALRKRMQGREGDVEYGSARLVGIMHEAIDGNTSLGMWNAPMDNAPNEELDKDERALEQKSRYAAAMERLREPDFSHGDAGVILLNIDDWVAEAWNGYGFEGVHQYQEQVPKGKPVSRVRVDFGGLVLLELAGKEV